MKPRVSRESKCSAPVVTKRASRGEDRIEQGARYNGIWAQRPNTTIPTTEVALRCHRLWTVEELFRSMKALLSTRPIWHKRDEAIRGHDFCTCLALVLRKALEDRLEVAGMDEEWARVLADLGRLTHVDVEKDGDASGFDRPPRAPPGRSSRPLGSQSRRQ